MKTLAKILGLLALAATIVPPALIMFKLMSQELMQGIMLTATFVWFVTAPVWLKGSD